MNTLDYDKIPDSLFRPVIKVRDILRARILSTAEKQKIKHGEPDIYVMSPMGTSNLLHRNSLVQYYKYIDGSKIKLSSWKSKLSYIVTAEDNGEAYAFRVPNEMKVRVGSKVAEGSEYIICGSVDGEIDRDKHFIIKERYFRKMFRIMQRQVTSKKQKTKIAVREEVKAEYIVDKTIYTAVARVVNSGSTVGFILQSKQGEKIQVNKTDIVGLCSRKQVTNIILNKTSEGKTYLQGQGIKISELPAVGI